MQVNQLVALYERLHPELAIPGSIELEKLLTGKNGRQYRVQDHGNGRLTMTDVGRGHVVLSLDLTPYVAPREPSAG